MPRQPKLDDPMPGSTAGETRADRLIFLLRTGAFLATAAESVGIHEATLYRWLNDNRPRFREFREAVTRARAEAEVNALLNVQAHARGGQKRRRQRTIRVGDEPLRVEVDEDEAEGDWRASAWFLERSFPTRYGRREALEVTGRDGGPVEVRDAEAARLAASWERFKSVEGLPPRELEPPPAVDEDEIVDAEVVDE